jgi:5-methylcytosine-specific restriction endonuclease McrA
MHGTCITKRCNVINYKSEKDLTSAKRHIFAKSTAMHHFWTQAEVLLLHQSCKNRRHDHES